MALKARDAKVILDKIELSLFEAVLTAYEKAKPVIASKAWLQRSFLLYSHLRGNERSRGPVTLHYHVKCYMDILPITAVIDISQVKSINAFLTAFALRKVC